MSRRRASSGGDLAAAAQRRLAALAREHALGAPDTEPNARDIRDPGPPDFREDRVTQPAPVAGGPAGGELREPRHVADRRLSTRRVEFARLGITAHQVAVAALLVLVLVVAVAWWALKSVPHAQTVQVSNERYVPTGAPTGFPSSTPLTSVPAGSSTAAAVTTGSARLVIDVAGKVRHPGIVELSPGSRVVDAIAAAGGARPGVSLTSLNLARLLVDGEQIVVGVDVPAAGEGDVTGVESPTASALQVDLNTATAEQLDALPDVGPVTAESILRWRAENGPFSSVDELLDVSGIGTATLADLRPYVYV
jgi:competence protein ComEA